MERTDKQILQRIKELSGNSDNFTIEDKDDEGIYMTFSSRLTEDTLLAFYKWIVNK